MSFSHRLLHVAVGVIANSRDQVLIAKRPNHLHMGGLWEFPGGKMEAGETVKQALSRELREEIGISVDLASPLIKIQHTYPEHSVLLDVWRIESFSGRVSGRENQAVAWVSVNELNQYRFPIANLPIITALRLPAYYAILDDNQGCPAVLERNFEKILENEIRLVQFRAKQLDRTRYGQMAKNLSRQAKRAGAELILNSEPALVLETGAAGVHLNSGRLMNANSRPLGREHWVSASCHDLQELQQAEKIGVDFAVLAPVHRTLTHAGAKPLEWEGFSSLIEQINIPVFALGGLALNDLPEAHIHGAQGIAGIRAFTR